MQKCVTNLLQCSMQSSLSEYILLCLRCCEENVECHVHGMSCDVMHDVMHDVM